MPFGSILPVTASLPENRQAALMVAVLNSEQHFPNRMSISSIKHNPCAIHLIWGPGLTWLCCSDVSGSRGIFLGGDVFIPGPKRLYLNPKTQDFHPKGAIIRPLRVCFFAQYAPYSTEHPGRPRGPQRVRAACTREPVDPSQLRFILKPVRFWINVGLFWVFKSVGVVSGALRRIEGTRGLVIKIKLASPTLFCCDDTDIPS